MMHSLAMFNLNLPRLIGLGLFVLVILAVTFALGLALGWLLGRRSGSRSGFPVEPPRKWSPPAV